MTRLRLKQLRTFLCQILLFVCLYEEGRGGTRDEEGTRRHEEEGRGGTRRHEKRRGAHEEARRATRHEDAKSAAVTPQEARGETREERKIFQLMVLGEGGEGGRGGGTRRDERRKKDFPINQFRAPSPGKQLCENDFVGACRTLAATPAGPSFRGWKASPFRRRKIRKKSEQKTPKSNPLPGTPRKFQHNVMLRSNITNVMLRSNITSC